MDLRRWLRGRAFLRCRMLFIIEETAMSDPFDIHVESQALEAVLRHLEQAGLDMSPVMRAIAEELRSLTEAAFEAEGPGWPKLAESTIRQRAKSGHWGSGAKMLQVEGQLAGSVSTDYGSHFAKIGAGGGAAKYAAIHQLGGTVHKKARERDVYFHQDRRTGEVGNRFVKRNRSNFAQAVTIGEHEATLPARPYLPIDADGNLQPHAEEAIMEALVEYFGDIVGY
jgi:phage virion morphogenesis protein